MNTRLKTIDLARGASVFIMILVHTLWMYSSTELQSESLFGAVIHIPVSYTHLRAHET